MDLEGKKFGRGPRELGGAVDLINHYKLLPHHDLFCKRSLPLSISETRYLHNVVGETEIRKGEGMELDQLFKNTSYVGNRHAHLHPFDLDILREAFQMRETTPTGLQNAETGESKDAKKHKKHKNRDKEKDKDLKKLKHRHKDSCRDKDMEKNRNGHNEFGPGNSQKQQDKKRRNIGSEDLSGIPRHEKSGVTSVKHKNSKMNEMGMLRMAH